MLGETKYQKVIEVKIVKNNKLWVEVTFENGTKWMPDLISLGSIISGIGKCEDIKYPNGQGHLYTQRFINRCFNKNQYQIKKLYKDGFDPNNKKVLKLP